MPAEGPDVEAAAAFLTERFGPGVRGVTHLGGGDWSRAFAFDVDDRRLVARFGQHREDYERDRRAMAFSGPDLPVPAVVEIGEALGGHYAISERYDGLFLDELDADQWRTVTPALIRTLDALRELPTPGGGALDWSGDDGEPGGSWRGWLLATIQDSGTGRTGGWRSRLREFPDSEAAFVSGERALREMVGVCPEIRHVLHRDLLNRNVLVADDGSSLSAVFDWGCSVAGDFVYEVAWFTFWSFWHPGLAAIDFRGAVLDHYDMIGLDVPDFDERLRCYEMQIALEHIAYAVFSHRDDYLTGITRRTIELLESPLD